jgi:alkaline phosphatase
VIEHVRNSSEALATAWDELLKKETNEHALYEYLKHVIIESGLGIEDATDDEMERIMSWAESGKTTDELAYVFADMVSRRALIGVSFIFFRSKIANVTQSIFLIVVYSRPYSC